MITPPNEESLKILRLPSSRGTSAFFCTDRLDHYERDGSRSTSEGSSSCER